MTISSRLNYNLMIFAAHIFGLNSSFHLSFPLDVFLYGNQILPLSTEQLELSKQSQSVSSHKAGFLCCPSLQLLQFQVMLLTSAWSALDTVFQRRACWCLYKGTVTSLHLLEIHPSLHGICYFHSSITLLIYSHPITSYYMHPPPSADFPVFR